MLHLGTAVRAVCRNESMSERNVELRVKRTTYEAEPRLF
jgi:hypothetical protein